MKNHKECSYYTKLEDNLVQCRLCPHNCVIKNGEKGLCRVRANIDGLLYSLNYGKISSYGIDPIEKKPLQYFYPQKRILSIGSFGCNMTCGYCQNYKISQEDVQGVETSPENIADIALRESTNLGIAFTYNEPLIWYEFVKDAAKINKRNGKKNVLVTNGYINPEPMKELLPYIDAMNIDLKFSNNQDYKKMCNATLQPVLDIIALCNESCHVEVTTLVVTGYNDNIEAIEEIAQMTAKIDTNMPLHLSRYFPKYNYNEPETNIEFMEKAKEIAEKHLTRVVLGNM